MGDEKWILYSNVEQKRSLFSCSVLSNFLWTHGLKLSRLSCPLSPRVCSNSCPLSWWCYLTISSSAAPFSSYPQSFLASGSLPTSQLFTSDGQNIGASASASVLPMNIQDWFILGLTALIPLQSKGLSRVFSNTTVWKHQFFSAHSSFWSNSHISTRFAHDCWKNLLMQEMQVRFLGW